MKRFFSSALIVCATLAVGLTGCQNDKPVENPETDGKNVAIKLFQSNGGGTRAVGEHVGYDNENDNIADDQVVTVKSAYIYFTTGSGNIVDYIEVLFDDDADEPYDNIANTVGYDTAKEGFVAVNLPSNVIKVIVAGNVTEGNHATGTVYPTTLSENVYEELETIYLTDQADEDWGVANVTLFGEDDLELMDPANGIDDDDDDDDDAKDDYEAKVVLKPIAARIEIGRISASDDSKIVSYNLRGIFINGAFIDMAIDGSTVGNLAINDAGVTTAITYDPENEEGDFAYGAWNNYLANYTFQGATWDDPAAQDLFAQNDPATTYGPVNNNEIEAKDVWAYNLLVPDAAFLPHIVIMVENVVVKGNGWVDETNEVLDTETYREKKFLTIRNYYWTNPVGGVRTKLETFAQGDVYRLGNIAFTEDDLTTTPEGGFFDASITIEPFEWNVREIEVDFNEED